MALLVRSRPYSCLCLATKIVPRSREIPTEQQTARAFILNDLPDGTLCALGKARRSGAQRGAPENNFGQRFSWAPLAFSSVLFSPSPQLRQSQRLPNINSCLT